MGAFAEFERALILERQREGNGKTPAEAWAATDPAPEPVAETAYALDVVSSC